MRKHQLKESINIVIVTYNNKDILKNCISSVKKSLDCTDLEGRITVVDNASNDGTKELIEKSFPFVNHIINKQNLGFARALNIGIREWINADYTMLLNDDVNLFPDTITMMVDTLSKYKKTRGIPACLIYPDGRPQRVKLKILGVGQIKYRGIQKTSFAGTTACLYQTKIFKQIGLFDEFYFFYNEDLDFSLRAKRKGIKFVFNPSIKVIHHRKKGRKKATKFIRPYYYATVYYFYRKNYGILFSSVFLLMAFIHILVWRKRFKKENENEKLYLLQEGIKKLMETRKNYKDLKCQPNTELNRYKTIE